MADLSAFPINQRWPAAHPERLHLLTKRASHVYTQATYHDGDYLVFGREMGPSVVVSHDLAQAGAHAAQRAAAQLSGVDLPQPATGPAIFDPSLLKAGLGFKGAKQSVVDAFEIAYLTALMQRNEGNITRSAQEAGLTRYHLRELLKRHGLKGGDSAD